MNKTLHSKQGWKIWIKTFENSFGGSCPQMMPTISLAQSEHRTFFRSLVVATIYLFRAFYLAIWVDQGFGSAIFVAFEHA
jgi:hypothetical protein